MVSIFRSQRCFHLFDSLTNGALNKPLKLCSIRYRDLSSSRFGDSDTFGNLDDISESDSILSTNKPRSVFHDENLRFIKGSKWAYLVDDDESKVERDRNLASNFKKLHISTHAFAFRLEKLIRRFKIKEALEMFYIQMLKVDKVKPNKLCFNLLMSGCSKVGYSQKVFELYDSMKRRGIFADAATYTTLFTACAKVDCPDEGFKRLAEYRQEILRLGFDLNLLNYHALMRAYGRNGHSKEILSVSEEMKAKGMPPDIYFTRYFLQSCICNKSDGFYQAILAWRQMRFLNLSPTACVYNLLLRSVIECGVADTRQIKYLFDNRRAQITSHEQNLINNTESKLPDLVSRDIFPGSLVQIDNLNRPEYRLSILGGWQTILKAMHSDNIKPDIRTFSLLLRALPLGIKHERDLNVYMEMVGIKPDVAYFNQLMKRRAHLYDWRLIETTLNEMKSLDLHPDILTFLSVAYVTNSCQHLKKYLDFIDLYNVRPTTEILSVLISTSAKNHNTENMLVILNLFTKFDLMPTKRIVELLENFRAALKQRQTLNDVNNTSSRKQIKLTSYFFINYKGWLSRMKIMEERSSEDLFRPRTLEEAAMDASG